MKVTMVVNPTAGRGRARGESVRAAAQFRELGIEVETVHTRGRGDGKSLAAEAGERCDVVVAFGGDGTVHEVAAGLYKSGSTAALAVIPAGSGNDFAKALSMPLNVHESVRIVAAAPTRTIDLGSVHATAGGSVASGVFVNAVGFGFDSVTAERAAHSRKMRGVFGYLLVALRTLATWRDIEMNVVADGWQHRGNTMLVTAGNGTCSGGGFYLTPLARPDDGLLDLCVVRPSPLPALIMLMVRVMRGKHLDHRNVSYRKVRRVTVESDAFLPVHLDGEILTNKAKRIDIEVVPGALRVRAPAPVE